MRLVDSVVSGALFLLVCFTALAFGSVYPWAFKTMDVAIFALMVLWLASLPWRGEEDVRELRAASSFYLPILLFVTFCAAQLPGLPPHVLAIGSSAAVSLYEKVLPQWPRQAPYANVDFALKATDTPRVYILPTEKEVEGGAPIPFSPSSGTSGGASNQTNPAASNAAASLQAERHRLPWYGISVSRELGKTAVLKACGYAALFLLVVGYPMGEKKRERRLVRGLLLCVVVTGVLVATLGLVNRTFWNGKILWVLSPADWSASGPTQLRASGPFVNPDDFANYLAMIFPLSLAGIFYNVPLKHTTRVTGFKLVSVAGALLIGLAILVSFSRAGWVAAACGIATFLVLVALPVPRHEEDDDGYPNNRGVLRTPLRWIPLLAGLVMIAGMIFFAVVAVGPTIAHQAAAHLDATVANNPELGMAGRIALWRDSMKMIRDYPLFGVGLGGWPALFPHYRTAPWFPLVYREAHNDYVQLAAETGLLGVMLVAWIVFRIVRSLMRARYEVTPEDWLLLAPIIAAIPVMGVHELVEFCFRIPANAFLFTLLLAIGVRVAWRARRKPARRIPRAGLLTLSVAGSLGVICLILATIVDPAASYPYDVSTPDNGVEALINVLDHPVRSETHFDLPRFMTESAGIAPRLQEFSSAVWLDPINPRPRDRYAQELFLAGQTQEALKQITISVYNAPAGYEHFYLDDRYIPFLTDAVVAAIEDGYKKLLATGDPGGLNGLSAFYAAQGRYGDQAQLLAEYIRTHPSEKPEYGLLMGTAEAYLRAGERSQAEEFFKKTIQEYPSDLGPYQSLITYVYGPSAQLAAAHAIIEQGVSNGVDPAPLYLSLLGLAQAAGDKALIESCLRELLSRQPSTALVLQLGRFYLDSNQPDRAASMFRRATDMDPNSADAFYLLGRAEESDYRYTAADDAYSRAISLAPNNSTYRDAYRAFRDKMKRDSSTQ